MVLVINSEFIGELTMKYTLMVIHELGLPKLWSRWTMLYAGNVISLLVEVFVSVFPIVRSVHFFEGNHQFISEIITKG